MTVLITGGAGYIGSATVEMIAARGERAVILDNLVNGHRSAIDQAIPFYEGDIADDRLVREIIERHDVDACIHFAAFAYVGESVADPAKYFDNNLLKSNALLGTLLACGVRKFVFSSTCATYGDPVRLPIDEDHPQSPVNPYGWTKFMTERMLECYDRAYGLRFVALRYFNAAGATKNCGEHHDPETHLIPNVLRAAVGELPYVSVFGSDYDTPDGTCIRDYIHVEDLADAHLRALDHLRRGGGSELINLGNGQGFSVLEVIETARQVTCLPIVAMTEARRPGDPPRLIADASRARKVLGWVPGHTELRSIIESAWDWKKRNPNGYEE